MSETLAAMFEIAWQIRWWIFGICLLLVALHIHDQPHTPTPNSKEVA